MLTDNNQIFKNCFIIIYCHLAKVSPQINECTIFEPNELSITISTLSIYGPQEVINTLSDPGHWETKS